MNLGILTVLVALNDYLKQFFSEFTTVRPAQHMFSNEMRYINLRFTYLLTNVTSTPGRPRCAG